MSHKGRIAVSISDIDAANKATEYFYQRFFILPLIGAVFGYHHTRSWSTFSYFIFTVFYASVISTIVTVSYSAFLNRGNLSVLSGCLHITITGFVVIGAASSLQYLRKGLIDMIVFYVLEQNLSEYQTGEYFCGLMKKTDTKLESLLVFWMSLYGCTATVAVTYPLIDVLYGYELPLTNITSVYWKGLPFTTWWPLNADKSYSAWITCFMSQGLYAFHAAATCTAGMLVYAICCENILNHGKLLVHALEDLDRRADAVFKKMHPGKSPKKLLNEYNECYYLCIVQNVKHHHNILKQMALMIQLGNIPLGVPFFGGALLLGLAGINLLLHDDPRIGPKFLFSCLGITEAAQMFLLCHYGERLRTMSDMLFNATFHTTCYKRSVKCMRAMMLLKYGCTKPMKVIAAKLIVLNMETFANLVNSAYSIFNLRSVTVSGNE